MNYSDGPRDTDWEDDSVEPHAYEDCGLAPDVCVDCRVIFRARQIAALVERVREKGSGEMDYVWGGIGAALVSGDPSKPGGWRFTRFDAEGPSGHMEAATIEDAVRYAYEDGYRAWAPGAVARALERAK